MFFFFHKCDVRIHSMYIHGKILVSTILNREQLNVKSDDTDTHERIATICTTYTLLNGCIY